MNKLKFNIHLILNSKYKLFYHFAIIFLIYCMFYGDKLIFCMMEDPSTPAYDSDVSLESEESSNINFIASESLAEPKYYRNNKLPLSSFPYEDEVCLLPNGNFEVKRVAGSTTIRENIIKAVEEEQRRRAGRSPIYLGELLLDLAEEKKDK